MSFILLVFACTSEALSPELDLTLTLRDDAPGVVNVSLADPDDACSFVWSNEDAAGTQPAVLAGNALTASLDGLVSGTELSVYAQCEVLGDGPLATVELLSAPSGADDLEMIDQPEESTAARGFLFSDLRQSESWVVVTDMRARPIWWHKFSGAVVTHVRQNPDTGEMYAAYNGSDDDGLIVMSLSGITRSWSIPGVHHDAMYMGSGRYLLSQTVEQVVDGTLVAGDQLVLLDTESGESAVVWSAFEELPVVPNQGWETTSLGGAADWTHVNTVSYDEASESVLLSLYWDRSVVSIDAESWKTKWVLSGPQPDYFAAETFGPQHSVQMLGDQIAMFNNGTDTAAGSGVATYQINEQTLQAERTSYWQPDDKLHTLFLGGVDYADDLRLVSWGEVGSLQLVDGEGGITAQYELPPSVIMGIARFATLPR